MGSSRLNERTAQRFKEDVVIQIAGAMLGDLTCAAGGDVLMALTATLGVVGRAEAVGYGLHLFKDKSIVVERAEGDDITFIEIFKGRSLFIESIGHIIKSGGSFFRPSRTERQFV